MTTAHEQQSDSLIAAIAEVGIPAENHEFIQRFTTAIGIAEYRPVVRSTKSYVLAKRRDGSLPTSTSIGVTQQGSRTKTRSTKPQAPDADAGLVQHGSRPGTSCTHSPGCPNVCPVH